MQMNENLKTKQAVIEFNEWRDKNYTADADEQYQKLAKIYRTTLQEIAHIPLVWTTFYRDAVVSKDIKNKKNNLYGAISDLIEKQKEKDFNTISFDEKIAILNQISGKYKFDLKPYNWVELNKALNPDLGYRKDELIKAIENFTRAVSLKKQGDFAAAKECFNSSLKHDPTNAFVELLYGFDLKDYAFATGMVDKRIHILKQAEMHFRKAVELNPYDAVCEEVYGILLKDWAMNFDDISKFKLAKKHFVRALDLEPGNVAIQQAFFWFYVDYEKALKKQQGITETGQRVIDDKEVAIRKAKTIFASYDLGDILYAEEVIWGFVNRLYLVETNRGMYIFKQCVGHPSLEEIESEYNLVRYLKGKGFPVADIIDNKSGANKGIFVEMDGKNYIVCEYIAGSQILFDTVEGAKLANMAKILAKYHALIASYEKEVISKSPGLDSFINNISSFEIIKNTLDGKAPESLSKAARLFIDNYAYLMTQVSTSRKNFSLDYYSQLPKLTVHGDYDSLNIKFIDDNVSGIFDWDNIRKEIRIFDITVCMYKMHAFTSGSDIYMEMISNFVEVYNEFSPLSKDETKSLPEVFRLMFLNDILEKLSTIDKVQNNSDMDNKLCISLLFNVNCLKMIDKQDWGSL